MDTFLFSSLLIFLLAIYLLMGWTTSSKHSDEEQYLLGSRGLGGFALATSIVATQLGGGSLMGAAQQAYMSGWSVLLYPMGSCLGLLTLAWGLGARWRRLRLSTISELFERVYDSLFLRRLSAALSIASLMLLLVGQGVAARAFLQTLFSEGNGWIFWSFWIVLIAYTAMGGLHAVVLTDIVQTLFILFAIVLAAGYIVTKAPFSWSDLIAGPIPMAQAQLMSSHSGKWLLLPFLFMLIEQDMGQRCFAAKSHKAVTFATFSAAMMMMMAAALPVALGIYGAISGVTVEAGESALIKTVELATTPQISALFVLAILMAIISTADSLLCSITSNICFDFLQTYRGTLPKVDLAKISTVIIGLSAMLLSSYFNDIVDVLMLAYELSVSLLFLPLIVASFSKKLPQPLAYSAVAASTVTFIAIKVAAPSLLAAPLSITAAALAMLCSFYIRRKQTK